jgi:hypothetical protein
MKATAWSYELLGYRFPATTLTVGQTLSSRQRAFLLTLLNFSGDWQYTNIG